MATQSQVVISRIQNRRGTIAEFQALYPLDYDGSSGYNSTKFPNYNPTDYPNVLQPGEIGLCTDSEQLFIGSINGTYLGVQVEESNNNLNFAPIVVLLQPSNWIAVGPELEFDPPISSFLNIFYTLSDVNPITGAANQYSKNGTMSITETASLVQLSDTGIEINTYPVTLDPNGIPLNPIDISFETRYTSIPGGSIQVFYKHNFPNPLYLSTATIQWGPF